MTRSRTANSPPTEHPADQAIRHRNPLLVPAEHRADVQALLRAFEAYQAGHDDAAREASAEIGLQSPFLEWRVLLRGLMAYSAGDETRALENFSRLTSGRLPAQIAAPIRAQLDPTFADTLPTAQRTRVQAEQTRLFADPVRAGLLTVRRLLGQGRGLEAIFRALTGIVPALRQQAPRAERELAQVLYHTVRRHGSMADLPRLRKLFGPYPDDPAFHKLNALAFEDTGGLSGAVMHWLAYEAWLSEPRDEWPEDVARRSRALILDRVANLCETYVIKSRLAVPEPITLWKRALELAPDWVVPARAVLWHHIKQSDHDSAETVARTYLESVPDCASILKMLANVQTRAGRPADALQTWQRLHAVNPMDLPTRRALSWAHLALARRRLMENDATAALTEIAAGQALSSGAVTGLFQALASIAKRKLRDRARADATWQEALAQPAARLAVLLSGLIDSQLAKLTPAEKSQATRAFNAALAGPATVPECTLSLMILDQYADEGITFRGQKTLPAKLATLALQIADGPGADIEFEHLVSSLAQNGPLKSLLVLTTKLRERFPQNPVFALAEAEARIASRAKFARAAVLKLLLSASTATDPRHRATAQRAAQLAADYFGVDFRMLLGNFS